MASIRWRAHDIRPDEGAAVTTDTNAPLTDDTDSLASLRPTTEEAVTAASDTTSDLTDDDTEDEGLLDRAADRLERNGAAAAAADALGSSPLMAHWTEKVAVLEGDLDAESAADKTMLDTVAKDMAARPSAEVGGVDIAAVKAADPGFDDQGFVASCRETLELVRKARAVRDPRFADCLLSPQLATELTAAVGADEAANRHHVEPELEISSCAITAASVDGGVPTVTVRFHLTGEELDRDTFMRVVAGTDAETQWDEDWTFARTGANGCDAVDEDHATRTDDQGGWMVAHRGWVATAIQRVGAPDALDPQNI